MFGVGAVFLSLFAQAQILENPILFGSQAAPTMTVETVSELRCAQDRAKLRYAVQSSEGDRIIGASINKRRVRQSHIDAINSRIGSRRIAKIEWHDCPDSRQDQTPIRVHLEYEAINEKFFSVYFLRRDGTLSRE